MFTDEGRLKLKRIPNKITITFGFCDSGRQPYLNEIFLTSSA